MKNYFITAIGTDSGKTLLSAILTEALQADYWKPVQAGLPKDSDTVKAMLSNTTSRILPEAVFLQMPASPHAAAASENRRISLSDIEWPAGVNNASGGQQEDNLPPEGRPPQDRPLIIEGAGGCLVPLNDHESIIDLVPQFGAQVVLVSNHYLGSINHTLLTAELLRQRNYPVAGIVFNGTAAPGTEEVILKRTGYRCLLRIARHESINKELVKSYAAQLRKELGDE